MARPGAGVGVIYKLRAKVEGEIKIVGCRGQCSCEGADGLKYEFVVDEQGRLLELVVGKRVDAEKFSSSITPGGAHGVATIVLNADVDEYQSLADGLQRIESHLGFITGGSLRRIGWDTATEERVPESPEEERLSAISSFTVPRKEYPLTGTAIPADSLQRLVERFMPFEGLVLPKAFFREGLLEFQSLRYVQSFHNFYFVLEGFYAEGCSAEKEVIKRFAASADMARVTQFAVNGVFRDERHRRALQHFLNEEKCAADVGGIQRLIVRVRGNLHHFSRSRPSKHGTPFNQTRFESIAYLTMVMASHAIGLREVAISREARGDTGAAKAEPV